MKREVIIDKVRSEVINGLKRRYWELRLNLIPESEFLNDIRILFNPYIISDVLYEARGMPCELTDIIFRILVDCWNSQSNPIMIFSKDKGLLQLFQLYRSYRSDIDILEFSKLMDGFEYTFSYGNWKYCIIDRVQAFKINVLIPTQKIKLVWERWIIDKDRTSYLQWLPEEVMEDTLFYIKNSP